MSERTSPTTSAGTERVGASDAKAPPYDILVVNRDPEMRLLLEKSFFLGDFSSVRVGASRDALAYLESTPCHLVVVSIGSPESVELVRTIATMAPEIRVIAISAAATPELVREVLTAGAVEFLFGTFKSKKLIARIRSCLDDAAKAAGSTERKDAIAEAGQPSDATSVSTPATAAARKPAADSSDSATRIIAKNRMTLRVLETARKVAPTDSTVLIEGESGTGKELLARYIHERSKRVGGTFVDVNCGALPANLLESQLFGHEKGSFTGASQRQLGLFEVANEGTIFLDEIGEMSLDMQVKLLRVLQSHEFRRIGGSQTVRVDVRVLAATNRDLKADVDSGRFRRDLYYRLNVIALELPPLRQRPEEIAELVTYFGTQVAARSGLEAKEFSQEAIEALQKLSWEGNVRELENVVERLLLLSGGPEVTAADVKEHLPDAETHADLDERFAPTLTLDEVKKIHIARVLQQNAGNKMKSARMLKINVKTLYNLIKSLEIKY